MAVNVDFSNVSEDFRTAISLLFEVKQIWGGINELGRILLADESRVAQ